jgi:hypothetical protein
MDFTNLNRLMRCPRLYWWASIQHIDTVGVKAALVNGEAYHECKAAYLKMKLKGVDHETAAVAALEVMEPIMARITEPDVKRNISIARQTMHNYFEIHKDEVYETLEVEVPFAVDLGELLFVGKIDAIKNWPGFGLVIEETKSTSIIGTRWAQRAKPNMQIDGYFSAAATIMGKVPWGAILDVIPVTKDPNKGTNQAFRILTVRNQRDIDLWIQNVRYWWQTKMEYESKGFFPQNTENCTPLIGFGCDFTTLCEMYPDPHEIDSIKLPASYEVSEWVPFEELRNVNAESQ